MEHLRAYCALAGESGGWQRYCAEFIDPPAAEYLARVGGAARVGALALPVF
jgi:glutaconate CoA-transferase subunit A